MIGELASAAAHARRIADVHHSMGKVDVVTSRALAPLTKLLQLSEPWLSAGAVALFHKGRGYRQEIQRKFSRLAIRPARTPKRGRIAKRDSEISDLTRI